MYLVLGTKMYQEYSGTQASAERTEIKAKQLLMVATICQIHIIYLLLGIILSSPCLRILFS